MIKQEPVGPAAGRARKPRRNSRDLVGVPIAWKESELRAAVKRAGGIWRRDSGCRNSLGTQSALWACTAGSSSNFPGKMEPEYIAAYGAVYRWLFAYADIWF